GTGTGSKNDYFLMLDRRGRLDTEAVATNNETAAVRWASESEARRLISMTTNTAGRVRDLQTLEAAFETWRALSGGTAV
ncbi:MAG: hypothetical protein ACRDV4_08370, partial [Acidimicrobiales bacterium]